MGKSSQGGLGRLSNFSYGLSRVTLYKQPLAGGVCNVRLQRQGEGPPFTELLRGCLLRSLHLSCLADQNGAQGRIEGWPSVPYARC